MYFDPLPTLDEFMNYSIKVLNIADSYVEHENQYDAYYDRSSYNINFDLLKVGNVYGWVEPQDYSNRLPALYLKDFRFEVTDIGDRHVSIRSLRDNREATVVLGRKPACIYYSVIRPYMPVRDYGQYYRVIELDPLDSFIEIYDDISWHGTKEEKELIKLAIDEWIKRGEVRFYILKAIVRSCENWTRPEIMRPEPFVSIMREGFFAGCMEADPGFVRRYVKLIRKYNHYLEIREFLGYREDKTLKLYYEFV